MLQEARILGTETVELNVMTNSARQMFSRERNNSSQLLLFFRRVANREDHARIVSRLASKQN